MSTAAQKMGSPNASHLDTLNSEHVAVWETVTGSLYEFILGNSWVLFVLFLLFLSFVKHSLMCWEVRQDKRRLQCCYMRHCQLLHAAKQQQQQQQAIEETTKQPTASMTASTTADATTSDNDAKVTNTPTPASESTTPAAEKHSPVISPEVTPQAAAAAPKVSITVTSPPERSPKTHLNAKRPADLLVSPPVKSAEDGELHSRLPSLQIPLSSTSSSDLSFSISPMSVTSRLFSRLTTSPSTVEVAPGSTTTTTATANANADVAAKLMPSGSGDLAGRRNVCFPRYTEDEQRRIDEKRQANAQAWKEAKRALESTENLASCGVTPTSSTTHRKMTNADSSAGLKNESF